MQEEQLRLFECEFCRGSGWVISERPVWQQDGSFQLISLPRPCMGCEAGRALVEVDQSSLA